MLNVHVQMYSGTALLGHYWDRLKCPDYRGVLISEVVLNTTRQVTFGTPESVLIREVPVLIREVPVLIREVPVLIREVPLFTCKVVKIL